jgi:hypothetical protein
MKRKTEVKDRRLRAIISDPAAVRLFFSAEWMREGIFGSG